MNCSKCGAVNQEGFKFCIKCGSELSVGDVVANDKMGSLSNSGCNPK